MEIEKGFERLYREKKTTLWKAEGEGMIFNIEELIYKRVMKEIEGLNHDGGRT
uniref:Uncharacterized protein n=1 Tax=Candidatus Methanophagaceae archaeon ANME-1 ERB6 TaxID=2759912 RepID=A0A7G9Z1F5_9EURY|nr:hypothetical protein GHMFPJCE_00016 [Methanosarcinales archaeon ANME-1 ERB6]